MVNEFSIADFGFNPGQSGISMASVAKVIFMV
jgi:hypothetical protein